LFSPIHRREDAGCHLNAGEDNLIFRAYEYRSRKVSLDFLGKEENDAPGDDSDNITVNPVVIGVNIGPDNQQPTSAELLSNPQWVTMCKSDILGVALNGATPEHMETSLALERHT